jgi:hypothetical protein
MPRNSFKKWTEADLHKLDKMYSANVSHGKIAKTLGRSKKAIENAFRNIVIQDIIHNNTKTVMRKYNLSYSTMYNWFVPEKYYLENTKSISKLKIIIYSILLLNTIFYIIN